MNSPPTIAICLAADTASAAESRYAAQLQLPLVERGELAAGAFEFYLCCEPVGLTLYRQEKKAPGGLRIVFGDQRMQRRAKDSLREQNLCKAAGLGRRADLHILDATAGLGKDAWLLACAGARVSMLERSPVVYALLSDAVERGRQSDSTSVGAIARIDVQYGDFLEQEATTADFDVVYLDPMFPPGQKQARAKKDMYLLQKLLGDREEDETRLLSLARQRAKQRVVVKRGKLSPYLALQEPDIEFKGSSNRYDVYLAVNTPV